MNFHPFYRNDKEVVKKEEFYTNYITVKFPVNIFTQKQANLNKVITTPFGSEKCTLWLYQHVEHCIQDTYSCNPDWTAYSLGI